MWFVAVCEPGEYVAHIDSPWKRRVNELTMCSYGPAAVNFVYNEGTSAETGTIVKDTMIQKCLKETDQIKYYGSQGEPQIGYRFKHCDDGVGYFFFTNRSSSTTLTARIEITTMSGIELLEPFRGQRSPEVSVEPGDDSIVLFKMVGERASINFRLAATFKKGASNLRQKSKQMGKVHKKLYRG